MMPGDSAIVNPIKGKRSPAVGPTVLLVGTQTDLKNLIERWFPKDTVPFPIYLGSIYQAPGKYPGVTVAGPLLGAPFAAMVMETLIAWGAESFLFMGWCGAVSPRLNIGDVVVPDRALIDEGTSRHYQNPETNGYGVPNDGIREKIVHRLGIQGIPFHEGPIWTTDAIFRETHRAVAAHQENGILAVEMEFSALCAVSRFRGVAFGGAMVVSDRLSDFTWQPGFKDPKFTDTRKSLADELMKTALS